LEGRPLKDLGVNMPIEVRLYGNLKKMIESSPRLPGFPAIIAIGHKQASRVLDIFRVLGIKPDEASHIFVNGKYSGLKKEVNDGDRVAIFPKNMSLIYKWYF